MQFDLFRLRSFQGNYSKEKKENGKGHFFIVIHNGSTAPAFIFFRSNELRRISAGDYGASDENGSTALLNLSFLLQSLIEAVRKDYGASDQM